MAGRIAVVDYCKGNLASVARGLSDVGADAFITDAPADIVSADAIVLPGVGAFADAMTTMNRTGQAAAIRTAVEAGMPFLGICLGLHLLFEWGDEGCEPGARLEGLGIVSGHVERVAAVDAAGVKHKVPHVGWNSVEFTAAGRENPLFSGIEDGSYFYFTHSYNVVVADKAQVIATTTHARTFDCAIAAGNVFGVQFHPEKSSALGLKLLENFTRIVEERS